MSNQSKLLLEIGCEELPPKSLIKIADGFKQGIISGLVENKFITTDTDHKVYASPRRLAVLIENVLKLQPEEVITKRGPPLNRAFDETGSPTKAALGFAKSIGKSVDELSIIKKPEGQWLGHEIKQKSKSIDEFIPTLLRETLNSLPIAKRMRWSNLQEQFIRPVHWLVVMHGSTAIKCELFSIKSSTLTYGHRFLVNREFSLKQASDYESCLENAMVIVDQNKRREIIKNGLSKLANKKSGEILFDETLLDEVNAIVEYPVPMIGEFDPLFLELPQEVLITSMQTHQKFFPIVDKNSKIMPCFAFVSNIKTKDPSRIIDGNERVLKARLHDATFFWEKDKSSALEDKLPALKQLAFHHKLGSMMDKVNRVTKLSESLADVFLADKKTLSRASELCKADLVSEMVLEFPQLQGIMGSYYALNDGEAEICAQAIAQHYRPRFANDDIPSEKVAKALAFADKIDTICAIFAAGERPSGDKDPFALRRNALGVLRILIEGEHEIDLKLVLKQALTGIYSNATALANDADNLMPSIFDFIFDRMKTYYQNEGVQTPLFLAVAATDPTSPYDFHRRIKALIEFVKLPEAQSLIAANKRINNLIQKNQAKDHLINPELLVKDQEKNLHREIQAIVTEFCKAQQGDKKDYVKMLSRLAQLNQSIDEFFDHVMVMDENQDIRDNRLNLLREINLQFNNVAHIAYLQ